MHPTYHSPESQGPNGWLVLTKASFSIIWIVPNPGGWWGRMKVRAWVSSSLRPSSIKVKSLKNWKNDTMLASVFMLAHGILPVAPYPFLVGENRLTKHGWQNNGSPKCTRNGGYLSADLIVAILTWVILGRPTVIARVLRRGSTREGMAAWINLDQMLLALKIEEGLKNVWNPEKTETDLL